MNGTHEPSAVEMALLAQPLGRRQVLKKGLVLGGVGAAAATVGGTAVGLGRAAPAAASSNTLLLEVACLGDTFRWVLAPGAHLPDDLRGSTFSVEGLIYPTGTVPRSGFTPTSKGAIGTWFCRGWFLIAPDRPAPHVMTTQEYILGEIRPDRLFPPDQLVSSGLEGSPDENQGGIRSVVGGTGRYAGARGVVVQYGHGTNTTTLTTLGGIPAPNFHFEFELH